MHTENRPKHARDHEMYIRRLNLASSQFNVVGEMIGLINQQVELADLGRVCSDPVACQTRRLSKTVKDFVSDYYKLFGWSDVEWKGQTINLRR